MPERHTTVEEWASRCCHAGHGPFSAGYPAMCLDCARAYARQVGEAVRDACAQITDSVPEPRGGDTGEMWRKIVARAIGRAIRALTPEECAK